MTKESLLKDHWLVPLVLTLASYPTWVVLTSSPVFVLVPILLTAFFFLIRHRQFLVAGLITGLCLIKLEYVPMLLISGLIRGRLLYLAGFVVAIAAVYFTAQQIPWVSITFNMPPGVSAPLLTGDMAPNLMQSFSGLLVLLLGDSHEVQMASLAVFAVLTISVAELWWRLHKFPLSDNKYLKASAVTILFMLTGSPHTYIADYIAVVPAAIWLWQATADDTRESAGTIRKMIIAFPFLSWIFFFAQPIFLMLRLPPYFLWATAMLVLTLAIMEDKPEAHKL